MIENSDILRVLKKWGRPSSSLKRSTPMCLTSEGWRECPTPEHPENIYYQLQSNHPEVMNEIGFVMIDILAIGDLSDEQKEMTPECLVSSFSEIFNSILKEIIKRRDLDEKHISYLENLYLKDSNLNFPSLERYYLHIVRKEFLGLGVRETYNTSPSLMYDLVGFAYLCLFSKGNS